MKIKGKVLIGVITKNSEKWMEQILRTIESYANEFENYLCHIIDGHSNDRTRRVIEKWTEYDPKKRYFKLQPSNNLMRDNSITEARNFMIDSFKEEFGDNVYLLILDADSPNAGGYDRDGFLKGFSTNIDWAGLFPNQKTDYYDIYALRDEELKENYQVKFRDKPWGGEMEESIKPYKNPKKAENGFYSVNSAFGGAGLYKTKYIKDSKYACITQWINPENNKKYYTKVCEHVPFNESIINNGGKLFINCDWYNNEHK